MNQVHMLGQKIKLGLFLLVITLVAGVIAPAQAQIDPQAPLIEAATVRFDVTGVTATAGETITVPLLLFTNGAVIDGLQLTWIFEGGTVSEAQMLIPAESPFTALKNEVTSAGGSVVWAPKDPLNPTSSVEAQVVGLLTLKPMAAGTVRITYDGENTLVASHETSQNIVSLTEPQTLVVGAAAALAAPAPLASSAPVAGTKMPAVGAETRSNGAPLVLGVIAAVVLLVGLVALTLIRRRPKPVMATPTAATAPPMPESLVPPPSSLSTSPIAPPVPSMTVPVVEVTQAPLTPLT